MSFEEVEDMLGSVTAVRCDLKGEATGARHGEGFENPVACAFEELLQREWSARFRRVTEGASHPRDPLAGLRVVFFQGDNVPVLLLPGSL